MRWVTINNSSSRYTPVQLTSAECVRETAWVRWRRSQDEILCPRDRRFCLSFPLTSWHLWFPPQPFVGWSELWRLPSNCLPEQSSSSEEEQLQFNESVPPWGWVLRWCAMRRWRCAEDRDVKRFVSVLFATTTCSLDFDNGASSSICREIQCPVFSCLFSEISWARVAGSQKLYQQVNQILLSLRTITWHEIRSVNLKVYDFQKALLSNMCLPAACFERGIWMNHGFTGQ